MGCVLFVLADFTCVFWADALICCICCWVGLPVVGCFVLRRAWYLFICFAGIIVITGGYLDLLYGCLGLLLSLLGWCFDGFQGCIGYATFAWFVFWFAFRRFDLFAFDLFCFVWFGDYFRCYVANYLVFRI